MRIIVAGGRDFNNYGILCCVLAQHVNLDDTIISGDAHGADTLGARWAEANHIPVKYYRADWDYYGHAAGFIRNAEMAENADMLIAFWDGKSKGTAHMIKTAQRNGLPYYVFNYNGEEIERGWIPSCASCSWPPNGTAATSHPPALTPAIPAARRCCRS